MTHLDTKTMARKVGTSEANLRTWARKFDIPIKKEGRKWLFPGDVVDVLQTIKSLKDSDCGYNTIQRRISNPEDLMKAVALDESLEKEKQLLQERISVSNERIQELEIICNLLQDKVELYDEHLATMPTEAELSREIEGRLKAEEQLNKLQRELSLLPTREQIVLAFEDSQENAKRLKVLEENTISLNDYTQVHNHLLDLKREKMELLAQIEYSSSQIDKLSQKNQGIVHLESLLNQQEQALIDFKRLKEEYYHSQVELTQLRQENKKLLEQQVKRTTLLSEAWTSVENLKLALQDERAKKVTYAQAQAEKEDVILEKEHQLQIVTQELQQAKTQQETLVTQHHNLEQKLSENNQKNEYLQIELNHLRLENERLQALQIQEEPEEPLQEKHKSIWARFFYWLNH